MKRLQTRVSADLTKYTENFFFGMSMRQTLLSAAGASATAFAYILLALPGPAAMAIGLPFFALAFLRPDGLPAEVYVRNWIRARILRPRVRHYHPENDLYELLWHDRLLGRTYRPSKHKHRKRGDVS